MKLAVHVLGRQVAMLEAVGDFKSVLTYHAATAPEDFVSLTMPVRSESYVWDDLLPPILQMNLPEGYLLKVLQEQFGPHIGASPSALLSVIGRNMIGRLQVAAPGADLNSPAHSIEVAELLHGDHSEEAFAELVRQYATSGVSGVVPKFLDAQAESGRVADAYDKASLITRRHIVKGASRQLPYAALNEHLCMQVAAQVLPTARTEVSEDGQLLLVHRFDVDQDGQPHYGMEDFCALLGLRPAAKYDTTWERIAKAVRDHVPGSQQLLAYRQLATTLLLNYALRNADCHAKNLALRYTSRADVHLAPTYNMLTTCVYAAHRHNPPAISLMGKKTWQIGKNLQNFIGANFGLTPRIQTEIVESIGAAVSDNAPLVRAAMRRLPAFAEIGQRMLSAWFEGVSGLHQRRVFALPAWQAGAAFDGISIAQKESNGVD